MKSFKILFIFSICILISLGIAFVYNVATSLKTEVAKEQQFLGTVSSEYRNT